MSGSFISELQRRNVIRVGAAYLTVAWLILQVAEMLLPVYNFTDAAIRNLVTVLAVGFLIALALAWAFEWTPAGIIKDSADRQPLASSERSNRRLDRFIIFTLTIAVALFALDKFVWDPARDAKNIAAAADKARASTLVESFGDKSIAVLAFADMSPAGDQEYFSDGIAEELLNLLTAKDELRVISRSTSFTFKGSNTPITQIAEKLNVTYIVEGSLRKYGNKIRITAQLIDGRTDTHLWSQTYDRDMGDIFAIQDEISASIVAELELKVLGGGSDSQRIDPLAYEKYLKAQHIVHTANMDQLREAQALLNEVLAAAPDYIPALNALGRLYYRIPKYDGISADQNTAEIHAIADRVVAIDPNGASALIWQGWLAYTRGQHHEAARYYERAIRVDRNNTSLLRVLVMFLNTIGRSDDAIALGQYLLLRDPACALCIGNLATAYRDAGRYEEAAHTLESILNWQSPPRWFYWTLGVSWLGAGYPDKALAAFDSSGSEMGTIMSLHDLGRMDEFRARFLALRNSNPEPEVVARIYAWIGDTDQAFLWLNKALEVDPAIISSIDTDLYAKIKSDARWRELHEKYGADAVPVETIDFDYTLPVGASVVVPSRK